MPKATVSGKLQRIQDCYIQANGRMVTMQALPEITDSKGATYSQENIIGRSTPLITFSHSDARTISWEIPFYITTTDDITTNLDNIFLLESLVYPTGAETGSPPPVAQLKCGNLLSFDGEPLCAILKNYSVKFGSDVAWDGSDGGTLLPYKCIMSTTWEIVYSCSNLPTSSSIFSFT